MAAADDGTHGKELWKSNGIAAGTVLVRDINPGSGPSLSPPDYMVAVGKLLFFQAENSLSNEELWQSDGTAAGTLMVADINPWGSSFPFGMTDVNGTLFFAANNDVTGKELWKATLTSSSWLKIYLPLIKR